MVYTGIDSYIYMGVEGSGFQEGDPSTDQHIPLNPFEEFPDDAEPKFQDTDLSAFSQLSTYDRYSNSKPPATLPLSCVWRDPWIMLMFFTHKTEGGTWGAGNTGTIQGDFQDDDDVDTAFLQYRLADQSGSANHNDRLLCGMLPMSYEWVIEPGLVLKENFEFLVTRSKSNTQAMSMSSTDFHDASFNASGGWAKWDTSGFAGDGKRSASNITLTWGGSELTGVNWKTLNSKMDVPYNTDQTSDALYHTVKWKGERNYTCAVSGTLLDTTATEISDVLDKYVDRTTTNNLKIEIDGTAGEEKYWQIANCHLVPAESTLPGIPGRGQQKEVTLMFKGAPGWDQDADTKVLFNYLAQTDPVDAGADTLFTTSP